MKLSEIENKHFRIVGIKLLLNTLETTQKNLINLMKLQNRPLTEEDLNDFFLGMKRALKRDQEILESEVSHGTRN